LDSLKHLDPPGIGLKAILNDAIPPTLPQRQTFHPLGETPSRQLDSLWNGGSLTNRLQAFTQPRIEDSDLLTPQGYEARLHSCIRALERADTPSPAAALHRALCRERELRDLLSMNCKLLLQV